MPCEILITAETKNHSNKGYPKQVRDAPVIWGLKENVAGGYIKLRITDASAAQVEHYLESWHKRFAYEILVDNEQGYRIRVKVNPTLVSISGVNRELKSEIKDFIVNNWYASIVSYDNFEAVVDIPKPVDLQELKDYVHDVYTEVIDHRHFYFRSADIDFVLTQPDGLVERTKAQVLSMIKDKLDE